MKRNYTQKWGLLVLMASFCVSTFAQISGTVTINSGAAASTTNFISFNALATALNTSGVSGPLTVDVIGGPYVEQVTFNQIVGASSANKITFNGNGNIITFSSASTATRWTIRLNGADYFTFNNLKVEATGATNAYGTLLTGGADYNTFNNCTFSVSTNNTGTGVIPFLISGSSTSHQSSGPGANYTSVESCTTIGGYYGISIYGNGSSISSASNSFIRDNQFTNNTVLDWYYSGIWNYAYTQGSLISGNDLSCPTRTNTTTKYAIYNYLNNATTIERNWVHDLFSPTLLTSAGTAYGVYAQYANDSWNYGFSYPSRYPCKVNNNLISDINFNGTLYGIYFYSMDGEVDNNTISFEQTGSTASGTTYGIYYYGSQTMYKAIVRNNIVSITRGGSGSKYGIYNGTSVVGSNLYMDRNNVYVNSAGGTNYAGFGSTNALTQANLVTQGHNLTGFSVNPNFVNIAGKDYHPTNAAINNTAIPLGFLFDQADAVRNQITPDIGALEFLTPNCSGIPTNTITGPNYSLCPGETANLGLTVLNSDAGITYSWATSTTSPVGPWTNIPGANTIFYNTPPIMSSVYYGVLITCATGGSFQAVLPINIAGPTQGTVPYFENFEGIGKNNRLPNCSWSATSFGNVTSTYVQSGTNNRVPKSGTSFATFNNLTAGTNYYYTHPIAMNSGITYSAAVWYATEYFGATNWTNLSIMVGPNQSPVGMVTVATVSPAMSGTYKLLDGTFTVPSAGNYYVAIKATSTSGSAVYLMIDDLSVTIPCQEGGLNTSNVLVTASQNSICLGQTVNLTAAGATSYSWSTGATSAQVNGEAPTKTTVYTVYGTNGLTGCVTAKTVEVVVMYPPNVYVVANNPAICAGQQAILSVYGATNVVWSPVVSTALNLHVTPNQTTSYSVTATGDNNCSTNAVQTVTVLPAPTLGAVSSATDACKDDAINLQANSDGVSFVWYSSTSPAIYQGNPITVQTPVSTIYTVVATGANNCTSSASIVQNINDCTGIQKNSMSNGLSVYPNPTTGVFSIEMLTGGDKFVKVTDVTGRVIFTSTSTEELIDVDLSALSAGVYYVTVQTENSTDVVKVVKN